MHRCTRYLHFPSFSLWALSLCPHIDTREVIILYRECTEIHRLYIKSHCHLWPFYPVCHRWWKARHLNRVIAGNFFRLYRTSFGWLRWEVHSWIKGCLTRFNTFQLFRRHRSTRSGLLKDSWHLDSCWVKQGAFVSKRMCVCVQVCDLCGVVMCRSLWAWPCSWTLYLLECWNCLLASSS